MISTKPVLVAQEVMNFVRENQLFELNSVLSELPNQINRLAKCHIAVIVAMD